MYAGNRLRILIVAARFEGTFTVETLVVASWKAHPDCFGMKEYPYPNAASVTSKIYGATGLVQEGYLELVEAKVLKMTEKGRQRTSVKRLLKDERE
jgi:hypothetical protein